MCECGSLPKLPQMKQDFFVAQMKSILVGPKDDSKNQKENLRPRKQRAILRSLKISIIHGTEIREASPHSMNPIPRLGARHPENILGIPVADGLEGSMTIEDQNSLNASEHWHRVFEQYPS
jgi:hypothetical protein